MLAAVIMIFPNILTIPIIPITIRIDMDFILDTGMDTIPGTDSDCITIITGN